MRQKDEEKRESIKQATFSIVVEMGVAGLKMAHLAKEVGISPSTLYVYFKDKEDLVLTLFREVLADMVSAVIPEYQPFRPFKQNLRQIWLKYLKYRIEHFQAVHFFEQVKVSHYAQLALEVKAREMEMPMQIIRAGQAQELLKPMNEHIMMAALDGMTKRIAEMFVQGEMEMNDQTLEDCFVLLWDSLKA